jgi:protein O-GlcNAc transferase
MMPSIHEALQFAAQCHQAGRLEEAEQICRQILAADQEYAGAWHLLGVIAYQVGKYDLAVEQIGRALSLEPGLA